MKRDFEINDIKTNENIQLLVRLKKSTFARTLLWLFIKFEDEDFIYTSDLARFLKATKSYSYNLLCDFQNFRLLIKEPISSNLVMWKPVINSKYPLLNKYVVYAKKTLGIGK